MTDIIDKHILLGITGGIAAYKSAELCRRFIKAGATVQVIMSEAACAFITPLTMETLSQRPVAIHMFDRTTPKVAHIEIAGDADLFVIAPATADYLARSAAGRAEDLISSVTLAFNRQVLAAPAMNTNMWNNPATKRNLRTLETEHGWRFVAPGTGALACGWTGPGRMAEPETIVAAALKCFQRDLTDKSILITAGPTVEDLDPVRFISNRSTGKMGYAIARAAASRGAKVTLISGPTALPEPAGVNFVPVRSTLEMKAAVEDAAPRQDAIIMSAAVADFRPESVADAKEKKGAKEQTRTITLIRNPDILAELGRRFENQARPYLVGFALETEDLQRNAEAKLEAKKANLIVANLASDGFAGDDNRALLIDNQGRHTDTGLLSKEQLAHTILDTIRDAV